MNTLPTNLPMLTTVFSIWILLLALPVTGQSSTTTIAPETAAPETTDQPAWFQGYYIYPEDDLVKTSIVGCPEDKIWSTRGDWATCCNPNPTGTQCGMATSCSGDEIGFDTGELAYCAGVCASMVIYETSPFGGPSATNYFCHNKWTINTIYRQLPEPTTTDTSSVPATTSAVTTSALTFDTSGNDSKDGNGEGDKDEDKDNSSSNNGWIAGAVIGPIAGIAIIILAVWLIRRRNQNRQTELPSEGRASPTLEPLAGFYKPPLPVTSSDSSGIRLVWNADSYSHSHSPTPSHSHTPPPPGTYVSRTREPRELENSERSRFTSHYELPGESRPRR